MFESIWIHQTLESILAGTNSRIVGRSIRASISQILFTEPIHQTSTKSAFSGKLSRKNLLIFWGDEKRYMGSSFWQTFFIEWYDQKSTISAFFGWKGKHLVNVGNTFAKIVYILQTACLTFTRKQDKWNFITSTQPTQEGHGLDPIAF